jgi:cellulose 1,4-beta-cellobiosidase
LISAGLPANIGMLIDTSRNGWGGPDRPTAASTSTDVNTFVNASRIDRRIHAGNWCNQSGAGMGERPTAAPATGIDAYVWIKPPGESDGSSTAIPNNEGKGFDGMCDPAYAGNARNGNSATGALAGAPLSGAWFSAQFRELMANAYPPLDGATTTSTTSTTTPTSTSTSTTTPTSTSTSTTTRSTSTSTPTSTSTSTTSSTTPQGKTCSATYKMANQWPGGFQGEVTITAGSSAISGWTVTWTFANGQTLGQLWNASYTGTSTVTAKNLAWNGALAPGASTNFGFIGTWNGANGVPTVTCAAS